MNKKITPKHHHSPLGKKRLQPLSQLAMNLRNMMRQANISEHELGRRTNIKQPIIHRILNGTNINPKLLTLQPIADYFMVSVSQLIGDDKLIPKWNGLTSHMHHGWSKLKITNYDLMPNQWKNNAADHIITEANVSEQAFALTIIDKSMEPLFPEKSIVIIEPDIKPTSDHFVAVRDANNSLLLRKFLLISSKKYVAPLNSLFGKIEHLTKEDTVLGVAIRTIYDHRME